MSINRLAHVFLIVIANLVLEINGEIAGQKDVVLYESASRKSSSHPIIHLHIPKTGGTALNKYIKNNWTHQKCQWAKLMDTNFQNISFATPSNSIIVSDPTAPCYWMSIDIGRQGRQGREVLAHMVVNHGVKLKYGTGHLPFGFCQFIEKGCEYTTILREPMDRLISQYYYVRESHSYLLKDCDNCDTFEGFIDLLLNKQTSVVEFDNTQTRMLCGAFFSEVSGYKQVEGRDCGNPEFGELNNTHLEIAKENLERKFPVVGLLDDLEMYQALMLLEYGYLPYAIQTVRPTTTRKTKVDDLSVGTRQKMEKILEWDLKLWDFVQKLVEVRIGEENQIASALEYVRNFDADLPKVDFRQMWDKSKVASADKAPGLVSTTSYKPV